LPAAGPLIPNFHDIFLTNVVMQGKTGVKLQGFEANTGGFANPAFPLVMSLTNVATDSTSGVAVIASDAQLTLNGTNLPLAASADARVTINGAPTAVDPAQVLDCHKAYVDFPSLTSPFGTTGS